MADVPKRKKGESLAAYHARLSEMIVAVDEVGDEEVSRALQHAAGKIARDHRDIAETCCPGGRGPGTYPWKKCVSDQQKRGYEPEHARRICGMIRGKSRLRYPEYWAVREGYSSAKKRPEEAAARAKERAKERTQRKGNPDVAVQAGSSPLTFATNPASDGVPFCALGLDGGPRSEGSRDNVIVLDRSGRVLDVREIHGAQDLVRFESDYPELPIFGPLHVLASDIRELRRGLDSPQVERSFR